jgi:hypothetical protein
VVTNWVAAPAAVVAMGSVETVDAVMTPAPCVAVAASMLRLLSARVNHQFVGAADPVVPHWKLMFETVICDGRNRA